MTQIFAKREPHKIIPSTRRKDRLKYFIEQIENQKPEEVHYSLLQAYANLCEVVEDLMTENEVIRKMIDTEPEDIRNTIMNEIVEKNHDYLVTNYKGEYAALTFDGRVVDHSKSQIGILKKIDSLPIPKTQVFVYAVPLM